MIKLSEVVNNIVTDLKALSWTSPDGGGSTSFNEVFNFTHNMHTEGYPYAYVDDPSSVGQSLDNRGMDMDNIIEICVCVNWSVIQVNESGLTEYEIETAKKTEASLRLREAWDAVKQHAIKISTLDSWMGGQMKGWTPNIAFEKADIEELNLFRRTIRMTLKEFLRR